MKNKILIAVMFCVAILCAKADAQNKKKNVTTTSTSVQCTQFTWQIIGDNHVQAPYQCDDPVTFEMRCGMGNQWYVMAYPTNEIKRSSGNVIAWGGLYFKTDSMGNATFIFNGNGCLDDIGQYYVASQDLGGWDVPPGVYNIQVRWGNWGQWLASTPLIIE